MKLYTYLALATIFLASCTTARLTTTSTDDVYYTPEDDIVIVQNAPQPAPEKYTPKAPEPQVQEQLAPVYDEEAMGTEDYAGVDDDYETRIRRFRDEDFEYTYENGYAQGYQDAYGSNRTYGNSYYNNGYGNSWGNDPWFYGNSYYNNGWYRPFNRGWNVGYSSRGGWYGGYSWGNPYYGITTVGTIQDIMEMEGTIDRTVAIDMAGAEMDMLLIMVGITLMEVEDTMGQIDIIEQQIAHASE